MTKTVLENQGTLSIQERVYLTKVTDLAEAHQVRGKGDFGRAGSAALTGKAKVLPVFPSGTCDLFI